MCNLSSNLLLGSPIPNLHEALPWRKHQILRSMFSADDAHHDLVSGKRACPSTTTTPQSSLVKTVDCSYILETQANSLLSHLLEPRTVPIEMETCMGTTINRPTCLLTNTMGWKRQSYNYPLNQAIQAQYSLPFLEAMISNESCALFLTDGRQRELALHVAVRHRPHDREICDMLLLKYPAAALAKDRHLNTALHIACFFGAGIDVVHNLCAVNPFAVVERNYNGWTPLDVAMRTSTAGDEIIDYLKKTQLQCCPVHWNA